MQIEKQTWKKKEKKKDLMEIHCYYKKKFAITCSQNKNKLVNMV